MSLRMGSHAQSIAIRNQLKLSLKPNLNLEKNVPTKANTIKKDFIEYYEQYINI